MRFRAKAGSEQFQFLADVVQHVHRLSETCLVKLGPTAIHLACNENQSGTGDGLPVFAKLSPGDLFFEYRIEARANNHILMSLKPTHMLRAARALRDTPEVTMTLTKKRGLAKLTLTARDARGVDYVQDVPVSVLGAAEHHRTDDPVLDTPEKIVLIRDSQSLRTVIDKMKAFHKHVTVSAAQVDEAEQQRRGEGWLRLSTGTGVVEVETKFDNMEIRLPQLQAQSKRKQEEQTSGSASGHAASGAAAVGDVSDEPDGAGDGTAPEPVSGQTTSVVKVDIKQLSQAMATTSVRSEDIAFCISTDYVLILYIKLHGGAGHVTLYLQGLEREEFDQEASDAEMEEGDA
eukprot:g3525.t1